jgi:hypothetical protein
MALVYIILNTLPGIIASRGYPRVGIYFADPSYDSVKA